MSESDHLQLFRGLAPAGPEVLLARFPPDFVADPFVSMAIDELGILTRLRHPNAARVIEVGHDGAERFLVCEYIDGITLRDTAPLDRDLATWIIAEACAGLHAAHELGIVHRAVKPSNVMIARDGTVKVIDFSMTKLTDRRIRMASGTQKHRLAYLSPEQCKGLPIDRRSDIWSLGVMLYELCAHARLFERDSDFEVLQAIAHQPVPALGDNFAPALEAIVMTALERDPDDRYATAPEMRGALLAVIGTEDRRADVAAAIAPLLE